MTAMKNTITYGKHNIAYSIQRVDRKTMEISVEPDMSIIVKAPIGAKLSKIESKLKKRGRWILKQQSYFKQFQPRLTERLYLSGETHFYLGKRYQLKVKDSDKPQVLLKNGAFLVYTPDKSQNTVQKLMIKWYRQKAKEYFPKTLNRLWNNSFTQNYEQPHIQIRILKKRWGSLSPGGILTINLELIKAPKECIDYVITHELCHLKYPNHNKDFYQLLEELIPNWKNVKHKLEMFMS